MRDTVLVTGGLGYIGSHTSVALAEAGYDLLIVDNLANANPAVHERLRELVPQARIDFARVDVRDRPALDRVLGGRAVDSAIHFAGLKAVSESVQKPLAYYDNNVGGSVVLLEALQAHGVNKLVFSSSATVYGDPERLPLTETHPLRPTSPYGRTKLMVEQIVADHAAAHAGFRHATLRYFNPAGAHVSGRIGEDPRGVPNNLFPYIARVAAGRLAKLNVWGNDYDTPDGTGVRDYIHVMDLARGHVAALAYLDRHGRSITANLGTGRGYSVLEAVRAFERAAGRAVPIEFAPRRAGDVAQCFADASLAARELGWRAERGLDDMCRDAWHWQAQHPDGFV